MWCFKYQRQLCLCRYDARVEITHHTISIGLSIVLVFQTEVCETDFVHSIMLYVKPCETHEGCLTAPGSDPELVLVSVHVLPDPQCCFASSYLSKRW